MIVSDVGTVFVRDNQGAIATLSIRFGSEYFYFLSLTEPYWQNSSNNCLLL
ncbi:MAG: hypothetical protein V7K62_14140 [Nostoc sp.]